MALTRKFLSALGIDAEKIDEIITAHTETVDGLKEQINNSKKDSESLKAVNEELKTTKADLEEARKELNDLKSADWEKKYNDIKSEYDSYKTDTEAKATKSKKSDAYRKLLKNAGVSENRIDSVLKVSNEIVDGIDFDADGNVKDADKLTEDAKKEWADFIPVIQERGANVSNPPANNGGNVKKPSRAAELVAQYRNDHYGNPTKED